MKIDARSGGMTFLLASMTAIGPTTMDIYLASLPHIGLALGATMGQVQLTLSLYLIGFAIGQIVYGPMSDALGRRPMLLGGFVLYIVATAACAAATSIELLIAGRIVQGLGAAGPIIIARATVRDLHSGADAARQLGLMSAIQGIAPICAPVVGGILQARFGWRSSFVALELVGVVLFIVALMMLPETRPPRAGARMVSPRTIAADMVSVLKERSFRVYVLVNALAYSAVFAFLSGISHVLQDLFRFSALQFGLTYAFCSFSYIGGNAIGSQLVRRLRLEGMLKLGSAIAATAGIVQVIAYAVWPGQFLAIVIPEMAMMFGIAFVVPQVMAAAMTPFADRAGAASSALGFTQMMFAAVTGALLGLLIGNNAWPMILTGASFVVLIFVLLRLTGPMRDTARADAKRLAEMRDTDLATGPAAGP